MTDRDEHEQGEREHAALLIENATAINRMLSKRKIKLLDQIAISSHHLSCSISAAMMTRVKAAQAKGEELNPILGQISDYVFHELHACYEKTIARLMLILSEEGIRVGAMGEGRIAMSPEEFLGGPKESLRITAPRCDHTQCMKRWIETGDNSCLRGEDA